MAKKKPPYPNRKLLVVGTTSSRDFADSVELTPCFNLCLTAPMVSEVSHVKQVLSTMKDLTEEVVDRICGHGIPAVGVKKLMLVCEMAKHACAPEPIRADAFISCLREVGISV